MNTETLEQAMGWDTPAKPLEPLTPMVLDGTPTLPPPGIYFGMPEEEYHALPALSSHGIREVASSPMLYWSKTPFLYTLSFGGTGFTSVNRAQLDGTREGKVESQATPGIRRGELVLQPGMGLELEPNACLNTHRVNIGTGVLVTESGCEPLNEMSTRVHHVATGP